LSISAQQIERETAISAYLYNFAKNIRWDHEDDFKEFRFIVYGQNTDLLQELTTLSKSKKIRTKSIVASASVNSEELQKAQLIYLSKSYESKVPSVLDLIEGKNCLLVCDDYPDKRLIMINFYDSDEGTLSFEINKANIINQHLVIMQDLILLGGTEIDVAALYLEGQQSLRDLQQYSETLERNVGMLQKGLDELEKTITEKNKEVQLNKDSLYYQTAKIEAQQQTLDNQNLWLRQQEKDLKLQQLKIQNQQSLYTLKNKELKAQNKALTIGNKLLDDQKKNIKHQEREIARQSTILNNQGTTIHRQRNLVILLIAVVLLVIILIISIYSGYKSNQKLNKELEKRVEDRTHDLNLLNQQLQVELFERIKAEKKLRTLGEAIEQSPAVIIVTDATGKIEFVNAKFTAELQYSLDEVRGKKPRIFNKGHLSDEKHNLLVETLKNGKIWKGEFQNRRKDGHYLWENVIIAPILSTSGTISNYVLIMDDITEKKQMLEELIVAKEKAEESDRLKTAFLHNVSHEIRTPMNAIIGFSDFLKEPDLPSEKIQEYADIIIQSSNQLLTIITDIINIATLEAGQEKVHENELNLNALFRLLHDQYNQKAQDKGLVLHYKSDLPDKDALIISDEAKLTTILSNLINNAIKFTEEGLVEFGYLAKKKKLDFYVKDTGIGIPPDMHELIFERFRQVEIKNIVKTGGSGLGLSISKDYVEMLGGTISVTSEVGKGSVFTFSVPFKKAAHSSKAEKESTNSLAIKKDSYKTILIAEDDDLNYLLLKEMLSDMNLNITRAINGVEAVRFCESNNDFNLILMDLKMPEMDGYEATRRIKAIQPDLLILAQSAYTTESDRKKALDSGCFDFISKPINKQLLLSKINERI